MDDTETQVTLGTRHGTRTNKNTKEKTKKMSNVDPTKTPRINIDARGDE